MQEDCLVCRLLVEGEDEVLLETQFWRVALAPDQLYLGRSYVTLKEHRASLGELSTVQLLDWHGIVGRYQFAVRQVFGAEVFNWGCLLNDTFRDPVPRPHVHWHVRPRYAYAPMIGGEPYADPNFGYHYDRSVKRIVGASELRMIAEAIREALLSA